MKRNYAKDILFGVAVGDALGVPHEFKKRELFVTNPVESMTGYGTYYQPAGTWSDDTSLTLCLAEMLTGEYSLEVLGNNFVKWYRQNYWTATGEVFDIGNTTRYAIQRLAKGMEPLYTGEMEVASNGNGSLMRILPLALYVKDKPIDERYKIIKEASAVTHAHIRSVISCFYYVEFALKLMKGEKPQQAFINNKSVSEYYSALNINSFEIARLDNLLIKDIYQFSDEQIKSSGYVIDSLEAAIWCLLTTHTYKEAVLRAVNLGEDTDTVAAITGGLAGIYYGFDSIPDEWLIVLAKAPEISDLADKLNVRY
ncbi:MAG TPA: ADP-ribosylglycohydrolase family protein [Bacteroidia bacterium]|nr:ADP-ribosylglycohydrolase family protein [Bacteroidia bacterium]